MGEELVRRLLSCLTAESGGLSDRVRARRRALIDYWYACRCHESRDDSAPLTPEWHAQVAALFLAYVEGYDRFVEAGGGTEDLAAWDVSAAVGEAVRAVDAAMDGYDEAVARGDHPTADTCVRRALGELFDWDNNRRLRAYVFGLTGEALTDAVAKKEKSDLLARLDRCRASLAPDIDTLLG